MTETDRITTQSEESALEPLREGAGPQEKKTPNPINKRAWIVLVALCVLNLVLHLLCYPHLPELVPLHWGADGSVDSWGERWTALFLDALPLLMLLLFYVTPKIDPRGHAYERVSGLYSAFVGAFTVFMICISWSIELTVFGIMPTDNSPMGAAVCTALGALFLFLGNYLPRVPRNYTFGIKTPWTLDNEQNWRLTHRFGGFIFMLMGVVIMIIGLALPRFQELLVPTFVIAILGLTGVVFVYSYLVFRHGNIPLRKKE